MDFSPFVVLRYGCQNKSGSQTTRLAFLAGRRGPDGPGVGGMTVTGTELLFQSSTAEFSGIESGRFGIKPPV